MHLYRKTIIKIISSVFIFTLITSSSSTVFSATSNFAKYLSYQGKLTDSSGTTVADGPYTIRARIYDAPTGGTLLFDETQNISTIAGLFSTLIGQSSSTASIDFNQLLYLGVSVNGDPEMTPRKVLTPSPATYEADRLDGLSSEDFLTGSYSTTSADYWMTQRDFFSTTSAEYFASTGGSFSTTSADYWITASTTIPKTTLSNIWSSLNIFNGGASSSALTVTNNSWLGTTTLSNLHITNTSTSTVEGDLWLKGELKIGLSSVKMSSAGIYSTDGGFNLSSFGTSTIGFGFVVGNNNLVVDNVTGNVGIGTSSPFSKLSISGGLSSDSILASGQITAGSLNLTGNSTTTFAHGININGGCFAVSGVCLPTFDSSWSTTSADYWKGLNDFFSTTSADNWLATLYSPSNWDSAYGWGDHSTFGYLTSETDPDFNSWDKSTGISITESQISDLQSYLTSYTETDPIFMSSSTSLPYLSSTSSLGLTTDDIQEGTNLYYTTERDIKFSTTSADNWKSERDFFSTTSASHFLTQNQSASWSTTSADYWETQQAARGGGGSGWSTTSSDYWKTENNFFSTTSADNWYTSEDRFSTTSSDNWLATKDTDDLTEGATNKYYSDTYVNSFIHSSTTIPKTYTNNLFTALQEFNNASTTYLTVTSNSWLATTTISHLTVTDTATSSFTSLSVDNLRISSLINCDTIDTDANGFLICGSDAGAGGGISSLGAQYSSPLTNSAQTFATSSDSNIQLSIISSGSTHTFNPSWLGTLSVARGGTGLSTITDGYLLLGGPGNTFTQVSSTSLPYLKSYTETDPLFMSASNTLPFYLPSTFTETDPIFMSASTSYFSLNDWYATNTSALAEGTNLYYTTDRDIKFSTTSADNWKSERDFFSTTSASHFLTENQSASWSTTSADYWETQQAPRGTSSSFSTTSADYWITASTTIPKTTLSNIWSALNIFNGGASSSALTVTNNSWLGTTTLTNFYVSNTSTSTIAGNLNVQGQLQIGNSSIYLRDNATSTFNGGINLSQGCIAVNGVCVGGGSGSGTVLSGITGQFPYYSSDGTTLTATSSIFVAPNGNVGIGTNTPDTFRLQVEGDIGPNSSSYYGAGTLTTVDSAGNVGTYTDIAIGSDGFPVISYYDSTNSDLKIAKCSNIDCASSNLISVDTVGNVGQYNSIAIGSDGFPVISYYDSTNSDLKIAKCSNIDCTSVTLVGVDVTAQNVGSFSSIAIGSDGFPVISYWDGTNMDLKFAKCSDISCSSSIKRWIDNTATNVGYYTSIAIGSDGFPVMSYWDVSNNNLKVAKCSDISCSSNIKTVVDSIGAVGHYSSIAIGSDGFPVISYLRPEDSSIKFAKCSNLDCSSNAQKTIDFIGAAITNTSIAIGSDGFPVMSYYDGINSDLKIAKCSDISCSSNIKTVIDSTGAVGFYSSIAIGSDGFPVMSYYDSTNTDLKVSTVSLTGGSNLAISTRPFNNVYANKFETGNMSIRGNSLILSSSGLNVSSNATSTFTAGVNLTSGCFSINGTCITGGGTADGTWSTTSADYWYTSEDRFSTTSTDYWKSQNNFFSTTSAEYFASTGASFSTTSTDYWKTENNFFSTTSADHWYTSEDRFSTTSSDYWKSQNNFFSTTSAEHFLTENTGSAFSTTSADHWITASTTIPKTTLSNIWSALNIFNGGASSSALTVTNNSWLGTTTLSNLTVTNTNPSTFGGTINVNGTTATSTFANGINITGGCLAVNGVCVGGGGAIIGSGLAGQFPYYETNGNTLTATSSIFVAPNGNVGIGTTNPSFTLDVGGTVSSLGSRTGGISLSKIDIRGNVGGENILNIPSLSTGNEMSNAKRITSTGNLVNIGSYQGGSMSVTGSGGFGTATVYTVGSYPRGLFSADFNGDGKMDIVTSNNNSSNLSVLINNGDGTFASALNRALNSSPSAVFSADFNGDGNMDIVVNQTNQIAVLIGNGDGTFEDPVYYSSLSSPTYLFASDLNDDGKIDILSNNKSVDSVSVFIGNGDGTFKNEIYNVYTGFGSDGLFIADINRDGVPDMVSVAGTGLTMSTMFGNGDGTFSGLLTYSNAGTPKNVTIADYDNDGYLDIANGFINTNSVAIWINNGDGTFATRSLFSTNHRLNSIYSADFNGDGKMDIVGGAGSAYAFINILLGNGDGTFGTATSYATTFTNPYPVFSADFNGDGKMDIATGGLLSTGVNILLNQPTSVFSADSISRNVTIGTLSGTGNRAVYSDANGVLTNSSSDARLKKNIENISNKIDVLSSLAKLRGVYFNWNTEVDAAKNLGEQREMGMIAQEVEVILPELIGVNSSGYRSLNYANMVGFLVEVGKEQQKNIASTTDYVFKLSSKLDDMISSGSINTQQIWTTNYITGSIQLVSSQILDMQGQDIVNIGKIVSSSGKWSIDTNGKLLVEEIEANKIKTVEFCMDGVCIDGVQFKALLQTAGLLNIQSSSPQTTETPTTPDENTDSEPPLITLLGNNPANIELNSTYVDMGAEVTDNKDMNLGYTTEVWQSSSSADQGYIKLFNDINNNSLNTSTNTTYLIKYNTEDSAGNKALEVTRTVIVGTPENEEEELPPVEEPSETPTIEPTEETTPTEPDPAPEPEEDTNTQTDGGVEETEETNTETGNTDNEVVE